MKRRRQRFDRRNKPVQMSSGLPYVFTDKAVTAWGGLRVMQELLTRLHFREMLAASPLPQPLSNRGYSPVLMLESFLVAVWVGGVRFAHTALVRFATALCEIFGWTRVPPSPPSRGSSGRFARAPIRPSRHSGRTGYGSRWSRPC